MAERHLYNINAGQSFVDVLAARFLQQYKNKPEELAEILFLLPTRRACQSLADAFVRQRGMVPTILPQILPIADVEEDEVFLTGDRSILSALKPAVDKMERALTFTRMIMQMPDKLGLGQISLAQAYALAGNLGDLIDLAENEGLSFDRLTDIVSAEYSAHWQETLKLLAIITEYWPQILAEKKMTDTAVRRNNLLRAELSAWRQNQTGQKIVVAGTTAAFPLLKELVKTVLELANGEVYLYGLDNDLEEQAWEQIDENHPQFELKELLTYLQIDRSAVQNIASEVKNARERLVTEIMRPAASSAKWRELPAHPFSEEAFAGIKLVNCDDIRQEAQAIALIIRHTLETPEKTAALVTYDRNLSRRVVSELKKWNITADDSAGQPLHLTPVGVYLRLIMNVLEQNFSQISLLSLLKHPFTACGMSYGDFNLKVRHLELAWRRQEELDEDLAGFLQNIQERLQPLADLYNTPQTDIQTLFTTHIKTAENLADTDMKTGEKMIWKGDAGACAAEFVSDFLNKCTVLGQIGTNEYNAFLTALLAEKNVRVRYGMHPRVKILGPIEARLAQYDVTILGEVNEGSWPKMPTADLWMSRPMKKDFGFPLPEKAIGVTASDFAHLLNGREVYLTRADRIDGTPTNKSRWWLRFETVLAANFGDKKENYAFIYDNPYAVWAKYLERAAVLRPIAPPRPCPPVALRPRKLSAGNIEMLMRDPYTIFAKYVLGLYPLHKLDEEKTARDFGNVLHKVMERFNTKYNGSAYPENAKEEMLRLAESELDALNVVPAQRAFWRPKLEQAVEWFVSVEKEYRPDILNIHNEVEGQMTFNAPAGAFMVTAKADRIDETRTGELNIIDYKSGEARHKKEMLAAMAPQLPIEGLIAENGGFAGIKKKKVATLRYWSLKDGEEVCAEEDARRALEKTYERLQVLVTQFDFEGMPYLAKPNPHDAPQYSDYDHLSRFLEWSVKDNDNDND